MILCEDCQGQFKTAEEVEKLSYEIMYRDTKPDYERGEWDGQEAMLRHVSKLTEDNNSRLADTVRHCEIYKVRAEILRQVAEVLEYASYGPNDEFDPEAAKACRFELQILQQRAQKYAGKKEEYEPNPRTGTGP
jgi:hypothetical protein